MQCLKLERECDVMCVRLENIKLNSNDLVNNFSHSRCERIVDLSMMRVCGIAIRHSRFHCMFDFFLVKPKMRNLNLNRLISVHDC